MCRANRARAPALVLLAALAAAAAPLRAQPGPGDARDEVSAYLERHDLSQLLATHLEQRLETVSGEARDDLVQRLVGIYARLLGSTDDPELLQDLERRSRRLLSTASPAETAELQLALLRGSYRRAEEIAEDHRLRRSTPEEVERAQRLLGEILPELTSLCERFDDRRRAVNRRLSRTGGREASRLAERADRLGGLHAQCTFVRAWSLYYRSWLSGRPDNARIAEQLFAELLGTASSRPQPEDVPVDFRSLEAIARSILGTALCRSLTTSAATAIGWLELLEHERTWASLREQVPAWKMAVYLEHDAYRAARQVLDDASQDVPVAWLRLAAVHALEGAAEGDADAAGLARVAVTRLAAGGELRAVLDLAERYGTDALGSSGFAIRYVRGVREYEKVREVHGGDEPTAAPETTGRYDRAAAEFEAALAEDDAASYPQAAASCRWLLGWCRFFAGRLVAAADAFEAAAGHSAPNRALEALWMAVVALDRAVKRDTSAGLRQRRRDVGDRILATWPGSDQAETLRIRRALAGGVTREVAEELLAVGPDSEHYEAARRRAAQVLHRLFREAGGDRRAELGNRYLSVAPAILAQDRRALEAGDVSAAAAVLDRSRRVLEVALDPAVGRFALARRVLDDLASADADAGRHADELDFRRVQQRLLAGNAAAAEAAAQRLAQRSPDSPWTLAARRALFRDARFRFRESGSDAELDRLVRHGRRLLEALDRSAGTAEKDQATAYRAAVAEALATAAGRRGDEALAREALRLHRELLADAPRDVRLLRRAAALARQVGELTEALGYWRKLVAGLPPDTPPWYEAKYHLVELLALTDPPRARAVLEQYRQLHPGYGPAPWSARFRELELRLGEGGEPHPEPGP